MEFLQYLDEKQNIHPNDLRNRNRELRVKIIKRFNSDKKVTLKELEQLAKKNKVALDVLYLTIFDIFNEFLYRRKLKSHIDDRELKKGIDHEMEHTKSKDIAEIIATDHLKQIPNYYTLLAKFDKE